jgi:hypothetical protein
VATAVYSLLADAVLVAHGLFVLFVVAGQLLILSGWALRWDWVRNLAFRVAHLGAIAFVVMEAWFGVACPLTVLERYLRDLAGAPVHEGGFVAYWISRLLFYDAPGWVFTLIYTLFGLLVVVSFLACPPVRRGAR